MLIKSQDSRGAAFFDLDLTLTDRDSFRLFLKTWYFEKISRLRFLPVLLIFGLLRKLRLISLKTFKEKALIGLNGMNQSEIRNVGDCFFNTHLKAMLRGDALEQIKRHLENSDPVFIISASPDVYVHAVCRYLGCQGYACTRLSYHRGRFTGRIDGPDCLGVQKLEHVLLFAQQYRIDLEQSFTYSDHEADLPFLNTTGKKVVVTPTRALHNIALERGWKIVHW